MSNKSNGTAFEREFAQLLSDNGFWAHCLRDNQNGQPFDVIAAKDGKTYVFDCKDCQSRTFRLCRIEENQELAMELWASTGNKQPYFVIRFLRTGIWMLSYAVAMKLRNEGCSAITERALIGRAVPITTWEEWECR